MPMTNDNVYLIGENFCGGFLGKIVEQTMSGIIELFFQIFHGNVVDFVHGSPVMSLSIHIGRFLNWNCICKLSNAKFVTIMDYFADVFWLFDHHTANGSNAEDIVTCFGYVYLLFSCSLNSQRPKLGFPCSSWTLLLFSVFHVICLDQRCP